MNTELQAALLITHTIAAEDWTSRHDHNAWQACMDAWAIGSTSAEDLQPLAEAAYGAAQEANWTATAEAWNSVLTEIQRALQ